MRLAAKSSTCLVVTPGWIKAATSLRTELATAQAGRMASRSRSLFRMITASLFYHRIEPCVKVRVEGRGARLKPSTEPAFFQKAIVMPHQEMGLHLTHGVQKDADADEHAGSAEELADIIGD